MTIRQQAAKANQVQTGDDDSGCPAKDNRSYVRDQVISKIRRGLMRGAFVPGQVMSLRKLAAALDTSPMPIREALAQLVAANALEELPNRSVCVPRLKEDRLRELFEVRAVIEGMAAFKACAFVTSELIERLNVSNVRLLDAIDKRDLIQCLQHNQEFHFTLYRGADSDVLMPLIESLWLRAGPAIYLSLLSPEIHWGAASHTDLLEALVRRDAHAAREAIEQDIRSAAEDLLKSSLVRQMNRGIDLPTVDIDIRL